MYFIGKICYFSELHVTQNPYATLTPPRISEENGSAMKVNMVHKSYTNEKEKKNNKVLGKILNSNELLKAFGGFKLEVSDSQYRNLKFEV